MQNLTNWSGARTLRASVTVLAEKLLPDPTGAAKELAEPRTRNERAMSDLMANLSDCRTFATSYQAPFSLLFRLSLKFDRILRFSVRRADRRDHNHGCGRHGRQHVINAGACRRERLRPLTRIRRTAGLLDRRGAAAAARRRFTGRI